MPLTWWTFVGLLAAVLVNRAADCWLRPARLQCGLTRYPLRQWLVLTGMPVVFALLALRGDHVREVGTSSLFGAILVLLAIIDLEQRRLPNVVVLPATVLAVALSANPAQAALSAGEALVAFIVLWEVGRRWYGPKALGTGDVKLAAFIGAVLGPPFALYALVGGILLAGSAAAVLLLAGRTGRTATLPYGHYLALAAVGALLIHA